MAHTLFMTRGHIDSVEPFIKELSTRYLPMKIYDPEQKKMVNKLIKMRLCPVQLWDISYPKEHRDAVHTTLFRGSKGEPIRKRENKFIRIMRKILKVDPIPDYNTNSWLPMSFPEHTDIYGIGVRDDYYIEPDGTKSDEKTKSENAYEGI